MSSKQGNIGVTSENIFPIIKKFLYSDHEIFLRELVSNAVDATQKLKTLSSVGEFKGELGDLTVQVKFDDKTITISDRGIGMTAEEIDKYINQIAFSGAEEFVEKYKNDAASIIGHFGLGFYSSFMVSKKVEIVTKSYKEGAVPMKWSCDGTPEYSLEETTKEDRGTDIILGGNAEYMAKAAMRKQGFTEELIEEATGYAETDDEEIINARNTFRELNDKYKEEIKGEAEKVREAGGLYIMGTERHESRRIDNQLRGRAGRQGDPGESRFYISLEGDPGVSRFFLSTEDDLMRLFGGDRMKMMMERMNVAEDMPIENKMLTSIIEGSQEKVELRNFGIRKDVLQYDDVMNKQREIIYGQRDQVLNGEDLHETILKMVEDTIATSIKQYLPEGPAEHWNFQSLKDYYSGWLIRDESKYDFSLEDLENMEPEEIQKMLVDDALEIYKENEELLPEETIREMERVYLLKNVDTHWMDHIDNMDQLKSGIRLRSYGQHDPVVEYRVEGFDMFDEMIESIREDTVKMMLIMPKRVYEIQKRQDAIAAAKRAAQRAAAAAQSASDDEEAVEQSDAVKQALHREQVAQPTETSADGTDSVNKTIRKGKKIGRNDPCPCGSGKKYKKCCGRDL